MGAKLKTLILKLMAEHNIMTVATVRPDGWPQATTVGYVNDGLTLYFGCARSAQKVVNIQNCSKVSLTIDHDYADWDRIQGLSIGGRAEILADRSEIARVGELMLRKFPVLAKFPEPDLNELALVRVTPVVVSVLDYTQGFGHSELVELPASANA